MAGLRRSSKALLAFRAVESSRLDVSELRGAGGFLVLGNVASGLFVVAYLAIASHTMGISELGFFATATALVGLFERLLGFGTWQAIIHFGSLEEFVNDPPRLRSLVKAGWSIDAVASAIAFGLCISLVAFVDMSWLQLGSAKDVIVLAAVPLLFGAHSTSTGLLRLKGKYLSIAMSGLAGPSLTLLFFLALLVFETRELGWFIIGWAIGASASKIILLIVSIRELGKRQIDNSPSAPSPSVFSENPRFLRFLLITYVDGMIRSVRDTDILIVNGILGPEPTGLYKIGRTFCSLAGRFTGPFHQAVLPILARDENSRNYGQRSRVLLESSLLGGAFSTTVLAGFAIAGPGSLAQLFGPGASAAYGSTLVMLVSMVVWGFAVPISPNLVAKGRVFTLATVHLLAVMIYLPVLVSLASMIGLIGAAASYVLLYAVWSSLALIASLRLGGSWPSSGSKKTTGKVHVY